MKAMLHGYASLRLYIRGGSVDVLAHLSSSQDFDIPFVPTVGQHLDVLADYEDARGVMWDFANKEERAKVGRRSFRPIQHAECQIKSVSWVVGNHRVESHWEIEIEARSLLG